MSEMEDHEGSTDDLIGRLLSRELPFRFRLEWSVFLLVLGYAICLTPHLWRTFPDYQGPDRSLPDWIGVSTAGVGAFLFLGALFGALIHPLRFRDVPVRVWRILARARTCTLVVLGCVLEGVAGIVVYVNGLPWSPGSTAVWSAVFGVLVAAFLLVENYRVATDPHGRVSAGWRWLYSLCELSVAVSLAVILAGITWAVRSAQFLRGLDGQVRPMEQKHVQAQFDSVLIPCSIAVLTLFVLGLVGAMLAASRFRSSEDETARDVS